MSIQILVNIIFQASIYLLLSVSFKIIYESVKFFHIAHAATITLGAYLTYFFHISSSLPLLLSILLAVFSTVILVFLSEWYIYSYLLKKKYDKWQILIVSIGINLILENIVSLAWGNQTLSIRTWPYSDGVELFDAYISEFKITVIFSSLSLVILMTLFLNETKLGLKIRGISNNIELSEIFGINYHRIWIWSFLIGSALASIGGILIATNLDLTPNLGFSWFLYCIIVLMLGGMSKTINLFLGAILLAGLQNFSGYYLDSKWMNFTAFAVLILFLWWKPFGIGGLKQKKAEV